MLMQVLTAYLWVALFTAISIWRRWTFTGSKSDYVQMDRQLHEKFGDNPKWEKFAYFWLISVGTFMWPMVYYYRLKDLIRTW